MPRQFIVNKRQWLNAVFSEGGQNLSSKTASAKENYARTSSGEFVKGVAFPALASLHTFTHKDFQPITEGHEQ